MVNFPFFEVLRALKKSLRSKIIEMKFMQFIQFMQHLVRVQCKVMTELVNMWSCKLIKFE